MFVYFIKCGLKGPVKIGKANNVSKRIAELQVGSPFTLSLITKIQAKSEKDAIRIEGWFHDRYHRQLIRGEWFKPGIVKSINANIAHALTDTHWDDVKASSGGSYERGPTRTCNEMEILNSDRVDKYSASRMEINHEINLRSNDR